MQIARPIPCKVWVIIGNLMMDRVPDFRVPGISQNMGLRQVEQGSSSFFAKFLAYLMIFQSFMAPSVHFTWGKKSSNSAKIWQ